MQCEREISEISQKHAEIKSECDQKVKEFEEIQRKKDSLVSKFVFYFDTFQC